MPLSYIKIYIDCLESIEPLDDAERGRLFTALLEYARSGKRTVLQGNERFLFPTLRAQLDRDALAYEGICARNRLSGALGGRPPKKPGGFSETQKSQDKDKEKDKDKYYDKDKEEDGSSGASRPGPQREGRKRDAPGAGVRDIEQMRRFMLQLRQEREELENAPA